MLYIRLVGDVLFNCNKKKVLIIKNVFVMLIILNKSVIMCVNLFCLCVYIYIIGLIFGEGCFYLLK